MRKHPRPARRRAGALTLLSALAFTSAGVSPAAAHSPGPIDYVALGDSYASGFGARPDGSSVDSYGYCGQSPLGLPGLLDARRKVELVGNATCAGALASFVPGGAVDLPEQVAALQSADVLNKRTDLVTVSAGGNDVGFGAVATACFGPESLCTLAIRNTEETLLPDLDDLLESLYEQIDDAAPKATVVVTGYPHLFSPELGRLGPLSANAVRFNAATDAVNAVIEETAEDEGFIYVDTVGKFTGHGIGSPEPWIKFSGQSEFDDLHPNAKGYELGYLAAVQEQVDLTRPGKVGRN
ncbi:SGNH/GDSL hydrolase family protein [Arthrobacter sp. Br18]|uniref:SGNH/GDSL hydrolase family protein n=1 Tax=Arthrobacter sp. Br18 TaxID=1312954 RepID=UPI0004B1570E|nr:SGNH/GDSL hydrolase family protein [Arthrobacter sp. Br18]